MGLWVQLPVILETLAGDRITRLEIQDLILLHRPLCAYMAINRIPNKLQFFSILWKDVPSIKT